MKACAQKGNKKMKEIISTVYPKRCLHRLSNDNWINCDMESANLYAPNTHQNLEVVYTHTNL